MSEQMPCHMTGCDCVLCERVRTEYPAFVVDPGVGDSTAVFMMKGKEVGRIINITRGDSPMKVERKELGPSGWSVIPDRPDMYEIRHAVASVLPEELAKAKATNPELVGDPSMWAPGPGGNGWGGCWPTPREDSKIGAYWVGAIILDVSYVTRITEEDAAGFARRAAIDEALAEGSEIMRLRERIDDEIFKEFVAKIESQKWGLGTAMTTNMEGGSVGDGVALQSMEHPAPAPRCLEGPGYSLTITDDDDFEFSSGAKFSAVLGIVGMNVDGEASQDEFESIGEFTLEQRREIAAYMISRWKLFAEG
jgi:hypothetical protein